MHSSPVHSPARPSVALGRRAAGRSWPLAAAALILALIAVVALPVPGNEAGAQGGSCESGLTATAAGCVADFLSVEACPAGFNPTQNTDGTCVVVDTAALASDDGAAYCASLTATHTGTSAGETIVGTPGNDIIKALGGDDLVVGAGGNDIICAGAGNDTVWGQAGDDKIFGEAGNDKLRGGDDDDILRGGPGADDLNGGRDNDAVDGGGGNDPKVRGGTGDDWVSGGNGNDPVVSGNGGRDSVHGGAGQDKALGGPRPDVVSGGGDDDEVKGHKGSDDLAGDAGDDVIIGGAQNDDLNGGAGTDTCNGGFGTDSATACESENSIETSTGGGDGADPGDGDEDIPAPTFAIDPSIDVDDPGLRPLGGEARPLGAIRGPNGEVATFVTNEIVVMTNNGGELNRILAAVGGQVLEEIDPGSLDLATTYLVRVDTDRGDPDALPALLMQLDDAAGVVATGAHGFSNGDAAALMALAAAQAAGGAQVGVNWVSAPDDIPVNAIEGPDAHGAYVRDAYDWSYFNSGSVQDIGVTDAWDALAASGRDENTIIFATIDKGFGPNGDWPADRTHTGFFGEDTPGSARSPWHGTHVMQTAAAIADNNFGIAGVAHQVVEPLNIHAGYDYFTSTFTVIDAALRGADVINMSYSADVPAGVSFTVIPFEVSTAAVRASNVLLFGSAGNDGIDVDNEDCGPLFGLICWESTWHAPCENIGVICVGGIDWNSQNLDPGSNFGSANSGDTVDIYAPFTVFRGADPDNPSASVSNTISGTSFSSPFTAAVAALIWAADPSQSANQVESRLMSSAHSSPDPQVNRYVNAGDPVADVIGTAVHADILSPGSGATRPLGTSLGLTGEAGFVGTAATNVAITWSSNRDGELAATTSPAAAGANVIPTETFEQLTAGTHTITLRVAAAGQVSTDSIEVTITNTPPRPSIDQPLDGADVCSNRPTNLRGSALDTEESSTIPGESFSWTSSRDGDLGTGKSVAATLSVGAHAIFLLVVDSAGAEGTDTIEVTSLAATDPACAGSPPVVTITSPENGDSEYAEGNDANGAYRDVEFIASVSDDETSIFDMVFSWTSTQDGAITPLSEERFPGLDIFLPGIGVIEGIPSYHATLRVYGEGCGSTQDITLLAVDGNGNEATDTLQLTTQVLC